MTNKGPFGLGEPLMKLLVENDETPCPKREDKQHCNCWYDGEACCACGDPALPKENSAT